MKQRSGMRTGEKRGVGGEKGVTQNETPDTDKSGTGWSAKNEREMLDKV